MKEPSRFLWLGEHMNHGTAIEAVQLSEWRNASYRASMTPSIAPKSKVCAQASASASVPFN
jgi:hypothetical protein